MSKTTFAHLRTRLDQGVLIVTVTVPHIHSTDFELVDSLRLELCAAIADLPHPKVALDLSEIAYFGSAGIRPLLSLRRRLHDVGGQLVLCKLSPQVEDVLRTTRLISTSSAAPAAFDVEADVALAVARLNRPPLAG